MHRRARNWRTIAFALGFALCFPAHPADSRDAGLVPVKLGISTLSAADQAKLWKRVDEWATADSLLDFCGHKMNIYRRGWNAVSACVDVSSLRRVGFLFRAKRTGYLKTLEAKYAEPEKKKALCDGLGTQLTEYQRILNAQIAEAAGMCKACLWC